MKTIMYGGVKYSFPFSEHFRRHTPDELTRIRESLEAPGGKIQTALRSYFDTDLNVPNCILDGEGRMMVLSQLNVPKNPHLIYDHGRLTTQQARDIAEILNDARRMDDFTAIEARRAERQQRVLAARQTGKSLRAIGAKEGVSQTQVARDLKGASGVTHVTPDIKTTEKIEGLDGKLYPATIPKAPEGTFSLVGVDCEEDPPQASAAASSPPTTSAGAKEFLVPDRLPPWFQPGNHVDPDHPFYDVKLKLTALKKAMNKAMGHETHGAKLLQYLLAVQSQKPKLPNFVLPRALTKDDKHYGAIFIWLDGLRALVDQAGRDGTKRPNTLLKLFQEALSEGDE